MRRSTELNTFGKASTLSCPPVSHYRDNLSIEGVELLFLHELSRFWLYEIEVEYNSLSSFGTVVAYEELILIYLIGRGSRFSRFSHG